MNPMIPTRRRFMQYAAACWAASAGFARAAPPDWPTRAVTFLQPYGPGTALDAVTRFLADQAGRQWKQAIVVENKAGANGVVGTAQVARAAPDGYTLLFTATGHFTNEMLMGKLPFDAEHDFKPVARIASVMLVLLVPKNSPFKSADELVAYARSHPGKLSYASAGSGSSQHLSAAEFVALDNIQVLHVPYKTQAEALTGTIGGQIDFTFAAVTTAQSQMNGGNLRALGVTGVRRSQTLPEVPTLAELGFKNYEFSAFNAVYAPAGTPDAIIDKVAATFASAVKTPAFAELTRRQGIEIDYAGPAQWTAAQSGERKRWSDLIRISGAKLE